MFDALSYEVGKINGVKQGTGYVVLETDAYTFTDENSDGNIVIEEAE